MPAEIAEAIAEMFCAELGVATCGLDDTLFRLGGDSIAATRLIAGINQRFDARIPFGALYRDSSPAALAALVDSTALSRPGPQPRSLASVARRRRKTWFPLAMSQEALWAMDSATQGAGLFNSVGILRLTGSIDAGALRGAIDDAVHRQSALRLVFWEQDGQPVQRFVDKLPTVAVHDWRSRGEGAVWSLKRRERLTGFDLCAGPPVRFTLARVAEDCWMLVVTCHHIVFDGRSQSLFAEELAHAYASRVEKVEPMEPLRWDYRDFAEWQHRSLRGDRLQGHLDMLRSVLGQAPSPRLAAGDGATGSFLTRTQPIVVPDVVGTGLRRLAADSDTTAFVAMVAAMLRFIARRTGHPRPILSVQAANRGLPGSEGVVGCFANAVCVGGEGFNDDEPTRLVQLAKEAVGTALAHQEMPLEPALRLLAERDGVIISREQMPQVGFALQYSRTEGFDIPGGRLDIEYRPLEGDSVDPTDLALVLELFTENHGLSGLTHYRLADWSDAAFKVGRSDLLDSFAHLADGPPAHYKS